MIKVEISEAQLKLRTHRIFKRQRIAFGSSFMQIRAFKAIMGHVKKPSFNKPVYLVNIGKASCLFHLSQVYSINEEIYGLVEMNIRHSK